MNLNTLGNTSIKKVAINSEADLLHREAFLIREL